MVVQECPPSLRWRSSASYYVLGDCRLGDLEPELEQFTMNARGAPQRVLPAHPPDKIAQLRAHSGSPWPTARFPAPIGPKPCSMPPQNRVRLGRRATNRAGLARAKSSIPITPGHSHAAADGAVRASGQY